VEACFKVHISLFIVYEDERARWTQLSVRFTCCPQVYLLLLLLESCWLKNHFTNYSNREDHQPLRLRLCWNITNFKIYNISKYLSMQRWWRGGSSFFLTDWLPISFLILYLQFAIMKVSSYQDHENLARVSFVRLQMISFIKVSMFIEIHYTLLAQFMKLFFSFHHVKLIDILV